MKRLLLPVACSLACALPAHAQDQGRLELSAFGRYTMFSVDRPLDDAVGVGGGVGLFLTNRLKLAVSASVTPTEGRISVFTNEVDDYTYIPIHARLVYELPVGSAARLMLGSGYVYNAYNGATFRDNGIGSMAGLKFRVSNPLSVYVQGTHDWMPPWLNPTTYVFREPPRVRKVLIAGSDVHWGVEAGLAVRLGGSRSEPVLTGEPPRAPVTVPVQPETPAATPPQTPPPTETATPVAPRYVTLVPVYFDFDKAEIRPDARATLLQAVDVLKANPDVAITLYGHTDQRGSDSYNERLGRRRAEAVARFLTAQGIAAARLEVVSQGESRPADPNDGEPAWSRNRRVEFQTKAGAQLVAPR